MNHKLKLVALMAIVSGSALAKCQAMQTDANATDAFGSSVVQPADPGPHGGSFTAVTTARTSNEKLGSQNNVYSGAATNLAANSRVEQTLTLPPIITQPNPGQIQNHQVANQPQASAPTPKPPAKNTSTMLAPLAPTNPSELPWANSSAARAPAPVIRATGTVAESNSNQQVEDAAQREQQSRQAGFSSAGVPLYRHAAAAGFTPAQQSVPPAVTGTLIPPNINSRFDSNPMPPVIEPESQLVGPVGSSFPVAPQGSSTLMFDNAHVAPVATRPAYDETQMNQTYFDSRPMEAPVINSDCGCDSSNCSSCSGGGCSDCGIATSASGDVSSCQSCSTGECFDQGQVDASFAASGSVYSARHYLIGDIMYFSRTDGTIIESNFGPLTNFQEQIGWRITFGRRNDATQGEELSYMGTDNLQESLVVVDAGGRINIRLALTGGFADTEMTAFREATSQAQIKSTQFQTIEFNKVRWGWDVVKTFLGIRYIYVEDDYAVGSEAEVRDATGAGTGVFETGLFEVSTRNNLLGVHFGGEMYYDVGYRLSWSGGSKFGIFVNPNRVDTRLLNAGVQFLDVRDESAAFSQSIEFTMNGIYQITKNSRLRIGYTGLLLNNVAEVAENIPLILTPASGADTKDSSEMFFQAISVGFEIYH